ncbi:hypothetical protein [Helicobacter pylori]|uniref:hypothetical protein n=1 Tax=Helicobacter pylori TaxID=210 RepID=UPI001FD2D968|nr:hypothetical protein [Helicobacter pylori]
MEEKNFLTDSAEKISINLTDFKKLHLRFSCLQIANLTSLGSKSAYILCYQFNQYKTAERALASIQAVLHLLFADKQTPTSEALAKHG